MKSAGDMVHTVTNNRVLPILDDAGHCVNVKIIQTNQIISKCSADTNLSAEQPQLVWG